MSWVTARRLSDRDMSVRNRDLHKNTSWDTYFMLNIVQTAHTY